MKYCKCLFILIVLVLITAGLSGCYITSATPETNEIIYMNPGDTQLFKVEGPDSTKLSQYKYSWVIERYRDSKFEVEETNTDSNEFNFISNPDGEETNNVRIVCNLLQKKTRFICTNVPNEGCDWKSVWEIIDIKRWELRISQDPPIWNGDYCIENQKDVELLSDFSEVTGNLFVGTDNISMGSYTINSLADLENITKVRGDLTILGNMRLLNLEGLHNLTFIGGSLGIRYNGLLNLNSLSDLTSVGANISIYSNRDLNSLDGLNNIDKIPGSLRLEHNYNLTSIKALSNITSIENDVSIYANDKLPDLDGLNNITSVGGDLNIGAPVYHEDGITYFGNDSLNSIEALSNITSIGTSLRIISNNNLEALSLFGLKSVGDDFIIKLNSKLCNSLADELRDQVEEHNSIIGVIEISDNRNCL